MFKLALCLVLAVSAANACQFTAPPGTTVTTKTVTTTTTSVSGGNDLVASGYGLSGSDRALIRSSWEKARKDGDVSPKILFNFLKAHPEYQKKFALFANVPQSELMKNGNFLAQAFTIMAGFNVIVQSLGSDELLAYELKHLGKTHFERGVSVHMFEQFSRAVVDALRDELHLSDEETTAWENGLKALVEGVSKNLKKAEDIPQVLTGLTPNQIGDVQRTWENIRGDRETIVSAIFIKQFKNRPSLQSKFHSFDDVPLADLASNADFKTQVKLVADRLDSIISHLNEPLKLGGELRYMAFSHKPRAVLRQEFEEFGSLLLDKLSARGISGDDLLSWKAVAQAIGGKIAKIQGI